MIKDALDKLEICRDEASNLRKFDERNTFEAIIRVMLIVNTQTAKKYAASVDKLIAHVKQGNYANTDKDAKRLWNAVIRTR